MTVFRVPMVTVWGLMFAMGMAGAPLTPAAVSGSVFFNLTPPRVDFDTFGTFPLTGPGGVLEFTGTPGPVPALEAEVAVGTGYYGRSVGTLTYFMQIAGPAGDVPVTALVTGKGVGNSITGSRFASLVVQALWWLENESTGMELITREGIETGAIAGSYEQDFAPLYLLLLRAGDVYKITMQVSAEAAAGSGAGASAWARLQQEFRFGDGVGGEYSFVFSDGIGNGVTPEPGAMGLLAVGACVLAMLGRKRR